MLFGNNEITPCETLQLQVQYCGFSKTKRHMYYSKKMSLL